MDFTCNISYLFCLTVIRSGMVNCKSELRLLMTFLACFCSKVFCFNISGLRKALFICCLRRCLVVALLSSSTVCKSIKSFFELVPVSSNNLGSWQTSARGVSLFDSPNIKHIFQDYRCTDKQ